MNDFVQKLKGNAVFQMSLSSKELFHSNFLAWLAEDEATLGVFNEILKGCFGVTDWSFDPKTMKVGREYKNFDFCICDRKQTKNGETAGAVRLILENKFKSIPYKDQLQKYEKKVDELNKKEHVEPTYILLTLADDFLEKKGIEDGGTWEIVSYKRYVSVLCNASESLDDCFRKEIIAHYCDFVTLISENINKSLKENTGNETWASLNNPDFADVRCNDLWQKLMMHKWAQDLIKLLKDSFRDKKIVLQHTPEEWIITKNNPIRVGVNYFHSQALMEVEALLPTHPIGENGTKFLIQQQGNSPLSIGFLIKDDKDLRTKKSKRKADAEWNKKVKEKAKELHLLPIMDIREDENYHSFQSKNDVGFYYKKGAPGLTIEETLKEMVRLIKQAYADEELKSDSPTG